MELKSVYETMNYVKKHKPEIMIASGMVGIICDIQSSLRGNKPLLYKRLYEYTRNEYYEIRYMQLTHSNNWLKMHGYPMRRKSTKQIES